jgi:heterodisulfide reductase subunit B2
MSEGNGKYAYYPGCSQQAAAQAYNTSAQKVSEALGLTLQELDDWNCCGATEYFTVNRLPAYSLVARNLAIAAKQDTSEVVATCSACYFNLRRVDDNINKYPNLGEKVNQALAAGGLHYEPGNLHIRHLLDVIVQDVGYDAVRSKVSKKLSGLRVAPYYGCLVVRPYQEENVGTDYPTHMDDLMTTLGATIVDFPMKARCCGGHMTQISEETAYEMIRRLLQNATDNKADVIVTLCPMCQLNLDVYQSQVNNMFGTNFDIPILYFTQLMGLALGFKKEDLGFGSEIVSAKEVLKKIGKETKEAPKPRKSKRRDKNALPMP